MSGGGGGGEGGREREREREREVHLYREEMCENVSTSKSSMTNIETEHTNTNHINFLDNRLTSRTMRLSLAPSYFALMPS